MAELPGGRSYDKEAGYRFDVRGWSDAVESRTNGVRGRVVSASHESVRFSRSHHQSGGIERRPGNLPCSGLGNPLVSTALEIEAPEVAVAGGKNRIGKTLLAETDGGGNYPFIVGFRKDDALASRAAHALREQRNEVRPGAHTLF